MYSVSVEDESFTFQVNPRNTDQLWYQLLYNQKPDIWTSFFKSGKLVIVVDDAAAIEYLGGVQQQTFRDRKRRLTGCKLDSKLIPTLGGKSSILEDAHFERRRLLDDLEYRQHSEHTLIGIHLYSFMS